MAGRRVAVARGSRAPPGVREPLRGSGVLLVRALLCFGRARLHSGLLRLGLLRGHVTLRGGLVLLGLAFLLQRLVPAYGPGRLLGPALPLFHDAFDACLRSRFVRQDRLPSLSRPLISFGAATRRSRAQTQRVLALSASARARNAATPLRSPPQVRVHRRKGTARHGDPCASSGPPA